MGPLDINFSLSILETALYNIGLLYYRSSHTTRNKTLFKFSLKALFSISYISIPPSTYEHTFLYCLNFSNVTL